MTLPFTADVEGIRVIGAPREPDAYAYLPDAPRARLLSQPASGLQTLSIDARWELAPARLESVRAALARLRGQRTVRLVAAPMRALTVELVARALDGTETVLHSAIPSPLAPYAAVLRGSVASYPDVALLVRYRGAVAIDAGVALTLVGHATPSADLRGDQEEEIERAVSDGSLTLSEAYLPWAGDEAREAARTTFLREAGRALRVASRLHGGGPGAPTLQYSAEYPADLPFTRDALVEASSRAKSAMPETQGDPS